MYRRLSISLGCALSLSLSVACSDSTEKKPVGGVDRGTQTGADSGTPGGDRGAIVLGDGGQTGNGDAAAPDVDKSCIGIMMCAQKNCTGTDQVCLTTCIAAAEAEQQKLFYAFVGCAQGALAGTCKAQCAADQSSAECNMCAGTACENELLTCGGGGGTPEPGFGDLCDPQTECATGFECMAIAKGAAKGICTKACTNLGGYCPGAAEGQVAMCAYSMPNSPNDGRCGFACKDPNFGEKACPTGMVCGTASQQGVSFCEPE